MAKFPAKIGFFSSPVPFGGWPSLQAYNEAGHLVSSHPINIDDGAFMNELARRWNEHLDLQPNGYVTNAEKINSVLKSLVSLNKRIEVLEGDQKHKAAALERLENFDRRLEAPEDVAHTPEEFEPNAHYVPVVDDIVIPKNGAPFLYIVLSAEAVGIKVRFLGYGGEQLASCLGWRYVRRATTDDYVVVEKPKPNFNLDLAMDNAASLFRLYGTSSSAGMSNWLAQYEQYKAARDGAS